MSSDSHSSPSLVFPIITIFLPVSAPSLRLTFLLSDAILAYFSLGLAELTLKLSGKIRINKSKWRMFRSNLMAKFYNHLYHLTFFSAILAELYILSWHHCSFVSSSSSPPSVKAGADGRASLGSHSPQRRKNELHPIHANKRHIPTCQSVSRPDSRTAAAGEGDGWVTRMGRGTGRGAGVLSSVKEEKGRRNKRIS